MVTCGYKWLCVGIGDYEWLSGYWGYVWLRVVTGANGAYALRGYRWLQVVMNGYRGYRRLWGLRVVTCGYKWLRGVIGGYRWIRVVTCGYRWYGGWLWVDGELIQIE